MSINKNIVAFALALKPQKATLVPERRKELTTEGGLNLKDDFKKIEKAVQKLQRVGIEVSLFIDPFKQDIDRAAAMAISAIELNTGRYSETKRGAMQKKEAYKIKQAVAYARAKGLFVAAGHGLDYENVKEIAKIKKIKELNIGHSIISRAVFVGLVTAVEEMIDLIKQ
jgi:pyridoxine 5-phosphate synthase